MTHSCQSTANFAVVHNGHAVRLCEAKFGNLFLYEGGGLRVVASHDLPPAFAEEFARAFHA